VKNNRIESLVRLECKSLKFEGYEYNVIAEVLPGNNPAVLIAENPQDGRSRGISRFGISQEELLRRHGRDIKPEILNLLISRKTWEEKEGKEQVKKELGPFERKVIVAVYYLFSLAFLPMVYVDYSAGCALSQVFPVLAVISFILAAFSLFGSISCFFLGNAIVSGVWPKDKSKELI